MIKGGSAHSPCQGLGRFGRSPHNFWNYLKRSICVNFPLSPAFWLCVCVCVSLPVWDRGHVPLGEKGGSYLHMAGKHSATFHHLRCTAIDFSPMPLRAKSGPTEQAHIGDNSIKLNDRKHPVRHGCYRATCKTCFRKSVYFSRRRNKSIKHCAGF